MGCVTAWELIGSIGSQLQVSESERRETLRLEEEVLENRDASAPSLFRGTNLGDLREEVLTGLARSFARAHRISNSAAQLHYVLHHTEPTPALYDLRLTGLPCLSPSVFSELQSVLVKTAQFEARLVAALSKGKFRNFPRHGGSSGIGMSPDDWTTRPSDPDTLRKIGFDAGEIVSTLRNAGIHPGPLHDAMTGDVLQEPAAVLTVDEGLTQDLVREARPTGSMQRAASEINQRGDSLSPVLVLALKQAVKDGVPVDRRMCGKAAYQVLVDWADKGAYPNLLIFHKQRLAHLVDDKPNAVSARAVQARVDRAWPNLLPILQAEKSGGR